MVWIHIQDHRWTDLLLKTLLYKFPFWPEDFTLFLLPSNGQFFPLFLLTSNDDVITNSTEKMAVDWPPISLPSHPPSQCHLSHVGCLLWVEISCLCAIQSHPQHIALLALLFFFCPLSTLAFAVMSSCNFICYSKSVSTFSPNHFH